MTLALRAKYVLTTQYVKISAIALILLGICIMLLLTNVATPAIAMSPLMEDSQPQPESATHLAGVSQDATVNITNTTDAFTKGQTLKNRPAFPLRNASAPVVTAGGDAQNATINTIEVRITYAASFTNPGDAFYTKEETVATKEISGTSGTLETTVDIRSVFERRNELEDEFGDGATVTPTIESVVTYQYTPVAGETQTSTVSVGGAITSIGALYSLPTTTDQRRHETDAPATDPTSPLANAVIAIVGGVSIVLFGLTLFLGNQNGRKKLARRINVNRYDEWVTEIASYTPHGETNVVDVQTLAGLVNLAIDINERVLYTPDLEEYIVMDAGTMYKYRSDESDRDGGSEFYGLRDSSEIPDMPEFDADGNPIDGQPPDENNPFDPADPDSDAGDDTDAESET